MRPANRPVFVVFEGLDGSGKSTCAKCTAEVLGACYLKTPSGPLLECRETILEAFRGNQEAAQLMYLASVVHASRQVGDCLCTGTSVVLDRYLLSTQVYAEFRGSKLMVDEAISAVIRPAEITVFLDAPLDVRRARIRSRSNTVGVADAETLTESADWSLRNGYRRRILLPIVGRIMTIDSSRLDVEAIASAVATLVLQVRKE